ncbi:MAG: hypothetical protein 1 [Marnaviridae sp.]|nr:MAG: hypothetical protein 1 [Marnaviridae sp.]
MIIASLAPQALPRSNEPWSYPRKLAYKAISKLEVLESNIAPPGVSAQEELPSVGTKGSPVPTNPVMLTKQQVLKNEKYESQSGLLSRAMSMVKDEAIASIVANQDLITREVEDIILLYIRLRDCKSWTGVMANIVSDVKKRFTTSISGVVLQCIEDLFSDPNSKRERGFIERFSGQGFGDEDEKSESETEDTPLEAEWLQSLKTAYSDWKLATKNEGFERVSKLLSLLVGAGMINMTSLTLDVAGLSLFSELNVPKHVSAFDLFDASFATIIYFVEGGYECICTGDLKPLLYGEMEMRKFDENYLLCCKYADYARPGNLALLSIDENDLDALFESTLEDGKYLAKTTKSVMVKKHIQDRLVRLQDLQSKFNQFRQTGNMREKPYCIGIFGGTSVGKSTIGPLLMIPSLYFNNFRCDDESIIVVNEHDKYMSNYKSSINGVFLDDVGNTKADFVETAPTVRILEMVNNVKQYANMAEADMKGKVSIQPKVVVCTTNVKDFCAHVYSNEPVSIPRRANYIVTATVKEQFSTNNMLDEQKVFDYYADDVPEIPDLWYFTVEKAYPIPNKTKGKPASLGWQTVVWNGTAMVDIDIFTLIQFTNGDSSKHFRNQKKVVENTSNLSQKLSFCQGCRSHTSVCMCGMQEHRVEYIESAYTPSPMDIEAQKGKKKKKNYKDQAGPYRSDDWSYESWRDYFFSRSSFSWDDVYDRATALVESPTVRLTSFIPASCFRSMMFRIILSWFYGRFPKRVFIAHMLLPVLLVMLISVLCPSLQIAILTFLILSCMSCIYTWRCESDLLMESLSGVRTAEQSFATEKKKRVAYILAGCTALAGTYFMVKKLKQKRELFVSQGMMHPTQQEIDERDAHDLTDTIAVEQNWATVHTKPLPVSDKSKTTTFAQLKTRAIGNTAFMHTQVNGKKYGTDVFFVTSNVALMPKHAWKSDNMLCEFVRHDPTKVGGNFKSYVSRAFSVDVRDMDASMIWIPNGGSWKDLVEYFPKEYPTTKVPCEFQWKDHKGDISSSKFLMTPKKVDNGCMKFQGCVYDLSFPTRVGFCMASLVAETKSPYFAGFHLGGVTGKVHGCAGTILRQHIDSALSELQNIDGVVIGPSEGSLEPIRYGIQFFEGPEIHEKSPLRKLPIKDGMTPNIEVFGSCKGRATYHSTVVQSCISKTVEKVCGVPNRWGSPKFNKGDPWHTSLLSSCLPSHGFEGDLLVRAVQDYVKPILAIFKLYPILRSQTRPLTRMETVCGIDGRKHMNKMPPDTSLGSPLSGPKRDQLTYLDPALYEGFQCPAELNEIFWDEFNVAVSCYRRLERYYPDFKACLKDEPTEQSKDKVRVFQAAPIVLQLLIRMYYLPIVRILSLFPALSECAVGVNCMGPDWSELGEHMKHFGEDRILAGDYSKYDLRMPAQVMFAAFRILMDMAAVCGYSEDDLCIMRGIATDVCYPVMSYNGDLIQHIGSNPSGQNLTVYINSVVNSLLFRCAFFALKGVQYKGSFRNVCKLMTYGDDVKGSVKPGHDDFNHLYVAKFFAEHDMKFTMPDKESVPTKFMSDADADFLKRKNVYCPETGYIMGALDENSIFKSLHSNLKSKANTREKLAADNIDGALREWFNHGRETYELRRQQMNRVAEEADISHMCSQLDKDFDYQVERWKDRYLRGVEPESDEDDVVFSQQSGEYCGDELIPYAAPFLEHCNGHSGVQLWWETQWINFLGLPIIFYYNRLRSTGRLHFVLPSQILWYHKVLIMYFVWTGGLRWIFAKFFFEFNQGAYAMFLFSNFMPIMEMLHNLRFTRRRRAPEPMRFMTAEEIRALYTPQSGEYDFDRDTFHSLADEEAEEEVLSRNLELMLNVMRERIEHDRQVRYEELRAWVLNYSSDDDESTDEEDNESSEEEEEGFHIHLDRQDAFIDDVPEDGVFYVPVIFDEDEDVDQFQFDMMLLIRQVSDSYPTHAAAA